MTVDGKITTRNFGPVDFTSREDKLHLFRQRALADAVIRQDRQSAEDFSVRSRENGTDPDFLDQTDAEKISEPAARGREAASE